MNRKPRRGRGSLSRKIGAAKKNTASRLPRIRM